MTTAAVSVCIPTYQAEPFITETLRSVLDQDVDGLEVIVSDNASRDGTVEIVRSFGDPRVRVLEHPENLGAMPNWNAVVSAATAPFVKLVCADDVLYPGALRRQVQALERHPDAAMAASTRDVVDERGRTLLSARGLHGLDQVVDPRTALRAVVRAGTNPFGEPLCVLMRRTKLVEAGPFDGRRPYVIDLDLWCRLAALGEVVTDREPAGAFRVNLGSWSRELAFRQGAQVSSLLRELRARHPEFVSAGDLALGTARAWALSAGRIASYFWLARRPRS